MLKQATTISLTSSGKPSLFYHQMFTVDEKALHQINIQYAFARDPVYNCTVVMIAAAKNKVANIKWAIDCGVDVHATDCLGMTALHYAVICDSQDAVKELLKAGARIDSKNNRGMKPTDYAVSKNMRILVSSM